MDKQPAPANKHLRKDTPAVKQEQARHNPDVFFFRARTLFIDSASGMERPMCHASLHVAVARLGRTAGTWRTMRAMARGGALARRPGILGRLCLMADVWCSRRRVLGHGWWGMRWRCVPIPSARVHAGCKDEIEDRVTCIVCSASRDLLVAPVGNALGMPSSECRLPLHQKGGHPEGTDPPRVSYWAPERCTTCSAMLCQASR